MALILAATAVVYLPSLRFEFVYDDRFQIMRNPRLRSWGYLPGYFRHHVWFHTADLGAYYRPLFLVWLRLNYWLFGEHPLPWHVSTVLLHLTAVALVYVLLKKTIADPFVVAFATAVFALHPAHIESVAWISGLTDSLMTVPLIGALICFLRARDKHSKPDFACSIFLLIVALLAKETAIIGPILFLVYAFAFPEERPFRGRLTGAILSSLPFFIVVLIYWCVRWRIMLPENPPTARSVGFLFVNLPTTYWFYLEHLLWPVHLSLYYDFVPREWNVAFLPLEILILIAITSLGTFAALRSGVLFEAWAWLVLPIGAAIGGFSVFASHDSAHDRYLYLATIGLGILLGTILTNLPTEPRVFGRPALQFCGTLVILSASVLLVLTQEPYWHDNATLFRHTTQIAPKNPISYSHLGREMDVENNVPMARDLYAKAVELDPADYGNNFILGALSLQLARWSDAYHYCHIADNIAPTARNDCYRIEARALMQMGRLSEAESEMRTAIAKWPKIEGQHLLLGEILMAEGRLEDARQEFLLELQLDPKSEAARANLSRSQN
ncbi:MAG TPA: tetratricopeptide repeat protein [Candidatus Koribacter sp.]